MKLYFGNAVATTTTLMILALLGLSAGRFGAAQLFSIGDAEVCFCLFLDLWSAALRRRGTAWISIYTGASAEHLSNQRASGRKRTLLRRMELLSANGLRPYRVRNEKRYGAADWHCC